MSGVLYLIATPIGNLEDITFRALRVLREADLVAAEDTRRTRKLLTHFDIHTSLTSYYEQNKNLKTPYLLKVLQEGKNIALVSDAGTPGISDPGSDLVEKAIEAGVSVVPVPGPTAFIAALTTSGLNTEKFVFLGFLPRKSKELKNEIEKLRLEEKTVVLYEAPHRILNTLKALAEAFPDRQLVAARELTKLHEEFVRGTTTYVFEHFIQHTPKGEFCLVLGASKIEQSEVSVEDLMVRAEEFFSNELKSGTTKKEAVKKTAQKFGLSKNKLYQKLVVQKETT